MQASKAYMSEWMDVLSPTLPSSHATAASQARGHGVDGETGPSIPISRSFHDPCGTMLPFRQSYVTGRRCIRSTAADIFCVFNNKVLRRVFGLKCDCEENFTSMGSLFQILLTSLAFIFIHFLRLHCCYANYTTDITS